MTLPPNKTIQTADEIIAQANSAGVKYLQGLITADVPFLGLPVISTFVGMVLGWLDGYLVTVEEDGVSFAIYDIKTSGEETAISKARAALLAANKSQDPAAIQKARQDYASAQSALVNLDGITPSA